MEWLDWLVLVHVFSVIVGLGPAYAFPMLLKKEKSLLEVVRMTELVGKLEIFPKLFGTLALLSGLLLFFLGSYGSILTLWLGGALVLYLLAEIVIIGFLAPAAKRLAQALTELSKAGEIEMNERSAALLAKVRNLHTAAAVITTLIIVLMVIKPE